MQTQREKIYLYTKILKHVQFSFSKVHMSANEHQLWPLSNKNYPRTLT